MATEEEDSGAASAPLRLVNFVSEEQLDISKKTRGERVEDGTAQRDKPLYEILKENKDKKDAEFNERFKHRPPKALDEDETEFLDNLEMSRKEYERQLADEEAQQLQKFQEAVAAQASVVREIKEIPSIIKAEEQKPAPKRNQNTRPSNLFISIKPQLKKAKIETTDSDKPSEPKGPSNGRVSGKPLDVANTALGGLVSYSDESDSDN